MMNNQFQQPVTINYYERIYNKLSSKQLRVVSILLLLLGIAALAINGVSYVFTTQLCDSLFLYIGHGFATGVFFLISGGLGIRAAKSRTKCSIEGCLAMAIISTLFACTTIALACSDIIHETSDQNYRGESYYSHYKHKRDTTTACLIADICLLTDGVIGLILSIWQAALCGAVTCCCSDDASVHPTVDSAFATGTQSIAQPVNFQPAAVSNGLAAAISTKETVRPVNTQPVGVPIGYYYSNNVVVPFNPGKFTFEIM